jgi:hypothetical protein
VERSSSLLLSRELFFLKGLCGRRPPLPPRNPLSVASQSFLTEPSWGRASRMRFSRWKRFRMKVAWGMISSPFLTEEHHHHRGRFLPPNRGQSFLQVFEDFQEEPFGILTATGKGVGILEPDSP